MLSDEVENTFQKGLRAFNKKNFYDSHEYWEDIWSEYRLPDEKFIQGLIQLSVGFYHITNQNLNGAKGLFKKCQNKFNGYKGYNRGISIASVKSLAESALENSMKIDSYKDFNWDIYYPLEVKQ